ncbi:hypothetical protein HPB47_026477 [Ixodes persulcatus]|uniref:Uncharacterized protein n=1 Tax=Ixodes persulcatus TaxID=34615 RepID=A0AC60Q0F8_IXOPE|nr:hypothetical protein HPB47_026477 [Ixodes persulcatus]
MSIVHPLNWEPEKGATCGLMLGSARRKTVGCENAENILRIAGLVPAAPGIRWLAPPSVVSSNCPSDSLSLCPSARSCCTIAAERRLQDASWEKLRALVWANTESLRRFLEDSAASFTEVGWTKPDPAATTEHKSAPVDTNRHSSGTEQHLDMDEEGRRRSERNRTRQTAAAGPPRLPATVATGTGSTSVGGSDDATTSQDGVAGQDSERSDTDTVGQRIPLAGPANVPPTIQTGLYGPTGDLSGLQTIVQEAVQAAVRGAVAGMADLLRPATQHTHDPRPPAESGKLVPVFNPVTNPVQTVEHWIRKVDELSAIYSWTEIQTACFALTKLEGIAKTWYDGLVSVQRSWLEWKLELKKAFPPVVNLQRRHQEMEARRKLQNETVEQYFHEKLSLARLCQLPEDQIVDYVITGISDEALVRSLSVVKFSTPEDLLECLKRLDDRLTAVGEASHRSNAATSSRAGKSRSPSDRNADGLPKRRPPFNSNGEPRCFNCDEYGHLSLNCSKPNKREHCSECHRTGHKTADCRSSGRGSVSVENHHIENKEKVNAQNEKYFQDALVDGKLVRAYVDLGSQCVTLRKVDADNLGISYNQPSRGCKIGGYGFGHVLPCGITEASVTVDQATARVPIYVVPSEAQAIPLLVGQPFTEQPHVTIVRRRNTLRIFEEQGSSTDDDERLRKIQIPDLPPRSLVLWAKQSVVIPPNYVGINHPTTKKSAAGHVFVDAQLQVQEGKERCLPACVINVTEGGDTVLPILNMSNSNADISKGDAAARGSWCSDMSKTAIKRRTTGLLEPIKADDVRTGPQLCPDLWSRYHLTTEDGPIVRAPFKTRPIKERYCYNCAGQSHFGHQCHMKKRGNPGTPYIISYDDLHEPHHQSRQSEGNWRAPPNKQKGGKGSRKRVHSGDKSARRQARVRHHPNTIQQHRNSNSGYDNKPSVSNGRGSRKKKKNKRSHLQRKLDATF